MLHIHMTLQFNFILQFLKYKLLSQVTIWTIHVRL